MFFSKSFGYALRSLLYIASTRKEKGYVPLDQIITQLNLPRQFVARILKTLAKEKILISFKGPTGGYMIDQRGKDLTLLQLMELIDGSRIELCVMKNKACDETRLCPAHDSFLKARGELSKVLSKTTIGELAKKGGADFVKSLCE